MHLYSSFTVSLIGKALRNLSGMFDQNDLSTTAPANPRPCRTFPSIYLANDCCLTIKVDELGVIMKQNTVDVAVITETWSKDDTLNLGTIQGDHPLNKFVSQKKW